VLTSITRAPLLAKATSADERHRRPAGVLGGRLKPCVAWVVNREESEATPMEVECLRPDCDISDPAWSRDGDVALIVASGEVK
jgi:hypothetical protein